MLYLSQIVIANQDINSFDELIELIPEYAKQGERFFRMDIKPPYPDTPENAKRFRSWYAFVRPNDGLNITGDFFD